MKKYRITVIITGIMAILVTYFMYAILSGEIYPYKMKPDYVLGLGSLWFLELVGMFAGFLALTFHEEEKK